MLRRRIRGGDAKRPARRIAGRKTLLERGVDLLLAAAYAGIVWYRSRCGMAVATDAIASGCTDLEHGYLPLWARGKRRKRRPAAIGGADRAGCPRMESEPRIVVLEHALGEVARTHQRSGNRFEETVAQCQLPVRTKLVRSHEALDRQMVCGRPQVLAEGDDIDVGGADVVEGALDLGVGFT